MNLLTFGIICILLGIILLIVTLEFLYPGYLDWKSHFDGSYDLTISPKGRLACKIIAKGVFYKAIEYHLLGIVSVILLLLGLTFLA